MKKPILATNVGGIQESIKNNDTGILINRNDSKSWINAINELIDSPEKRNEMGDAAYTLIEKENSREKIALEFVCLLYTSPSPRD